MPHSLGTLNTWCPVGDAVSGGLRTTALLEEVYQLVWGLGRRSFAPLSAGSLCFVLTFEDSSSPLPVPATGLPLAAVPLHGDGRKDQTNSSIFKLLLVVVFLLQRQKSN